MPIGAARYLAAALEENGVPHDYIEFPHSGYGLQNDNNLYKFCLQKLNAYLAEYLEG